MLLYCHIRRKVKRHSHNTYSHVLMFIRNVRLLRGWKTLCGKGHTPSDILNLSPNKEMCSELVHSTFLTAGYLGN